MKRYTLYLRAGLQTVNWQRLLQYGPVKIYRLEGETK